jgi:hypothetical protein
MIHTGVSFIGGAKFVTLVFNSMALQICRDKIAKSAIISSQN